jgi:archaellum biogenesis protein FlaJ (TadC family)
MSKLDNLITLIGRMFLSAKRREKFRPYFRQAGYHELPFKQIGQLFIAISLGVLVWYFYFLFTGRLAYLGLIPLIVLSPIFIVIAEICLMFITFMIIRLFLEVKAYNRIQEVEQNLPLFLREFSTNLKAGREFVDALESSTDPDMGFLHEDMQRLVVQIRSGKMIEKAFEDYILMYDSSIVEETFQIILDSYKGGSSLSEVIDKIAENLEVIFYLRKEAVANVSSYIIFISIVSLVIAPLLFALSYNLLKLIYDLLLRVLLGGASGYMPYSVSNVDIDFDDFKFFSQIAVAVIAGSAASVVGIIRKGSLKGSSFIILIFVVASIALYYIFLFLLTQLFGLLFSAV